MNVIVANKYSSMLQTLNIEVMQMVNGEFDVDYLVDNFKNVYYNKMILDITALKAANNIQTLQKLSVSLDVSKIIFFLGESEELSSNEFLSKIISMGIYNFTNSLEGILYLLNNSNTYRDVAQYHQISNEPTQQNSSFMKHDIQENVTINNNSATRIIGFKNVTKQAGATTLVYLCKKILEKHYDVVAIEVGKGDFRFLNDKSLVSATNSNATSLIAKNSDKEVILVDINDSKQIEDVCHDVVYLIEPSTIKLNRLMMVNSHTIETLKNKRTILNKSLLNSKDVHDFEYESRLKIFYNMPNLDDRASEQPELTELLVKLGFSKLGD